ncbi:MAG: GtrA family protein [Eubacteriales bacterium]
MKYTREIEKIKDLIQKYREIINYGIFGVLTTVINVIVYQVAYATLGYSNVMSTVIAWIVAVIFAYVTNRKYVFESQNNTVKVILVEIGGFFLCRGATGVLDVVIMYVGVDVMMLPSIMMKIASNILVIIINYIASKIIIFKKH